MTKIICIKSEILDNNIEYDNHCSDLYFPKNDITTKIVDNYIYKNSVTTFVNQIDGKIWYDVPFANYIEEIS